MTTELKLDNSPYQRFLGVRCERAGEDEVVIRLPFRDEFLRSDGSDWLHGGVVAGLIDIAGGYAIVNSVGGDVPTIDLRVDWLRPARRGDLTATGRTVKAGRRVCMADVEVHDAGGQLVAVGRGVWASPRQEESP